MLKNMTIKLQIFLLMASVVCLELQASERFTVTTGFTPPVSTYFQKILGEAGKRLGLNIDVIEVSAERSLRLVVEDRADAECCRINNVMKSYYPSLVDVPVSFYEMSWVAFVKDKTISILDWDDLSKYHVAAVTGFKLGVIKTRQYSKFPSIVDTQQSMFNMLERGRVQVAVGSMLSGKKIIREMGLSDSITILQPPILRIPLTLQLHPMHVDKVAGFTEVLTEMNRDGSSRRLLNEVLDGL